MAASHPGPRPGYLSIHVGVVLHILCQPSPAWSTGSVATLRGDHLPTEHLDLGSPGLITDLGLRAGRNRRYTNPLIRSPIAVFAISNRPGVPLASALANFIG